MRFPVIELQIHPGILAATITRYLPNGHRPFPSFRLHARTGRAVGSVARLGMEAGRQSMATPPRRRPPGSPNMAARAREGAGRAWSRARAAADVASRGRPTCPLPRPVATLPCGSDPNMAAPSKRRNGEGASWWAALLLAAVALRPGEAVSEPTTVAFDVRPGGVVHSFSQNVGPGDKYTCTFTYASQGGTNEKWQMSLGTSKDHQHFTCTIWRPQGKSYLYFTQFKAEVRGAEIEYGMAYSKAAFERESDVPLKNEEFEVTKTAVSHRPGAFKAELSKLVIVAKASRSEL